MKKDSVIDEIILFCFYSLLSSVQTLQQSYDSLIDSQRPPHEYPAQDLLAIETFPLFHKLSVDPVTLQLPSFLNR